MKSGICHNRGQTHAMFQIANEFSLHTSRAMRSRVASLRPERRPCIPNCSDTFPEKRRKCVTGRSSENSRVTGRGRHCPSERARASSNLSARENSRKTSRLHDDLMPMSKQRGKSHNAAFGNGNRYPGQSPQCPAALTMPNETKAI